jgi:putative transposase
MVDAYSGEVLANWLSYKSPSRESCAMVVRDCVSRHRKLPEVLVVDGGGEFDTFTE